MRGRDEQVSADAVRILDDIRRAISCSLELGRAAARELVGVGKGQLFSAYLTVRQICPVSGNDNEQYRSDDFAPYVTMFMVLHLLVRVLFLADREWEMSVWLEGAMAIPIFSLVTLAVLPFAKVRRHRPRLGIRRDAQSDACFQVILIFRR